MSEQKPQLIAYSIEHKIGFNNAKRIVIAESMENALDLFYEEYQINYDKSVMSRQNIKNVEKKIVKPSVISVTLLQYNPLMEN